MTSLTERYLAGTLRGLPESKRADVERELRSSIADAVADRVEAGEDRAAAEIAVLEGLGDPARLAAGYAGRPQYLIGPELFETYRQLLIRLGGVVIPLAAIVLTIVAVASDRPYIQAIIDGVVGAVVVGIQLVFWVTVVFVFIERADAARDARAEIASGRWTVGRLPDLERDRVKMSDTIGEIVGLLIGVGGLLFLRDQSWLHDPTGAPITILNPGLGDTWLLFLVGLLIAQAVVQVMVQFVGRWTMPLAGLYALANAAFSVAIVKTALSGELVNRAFAAEIGFPTQADGNSVSMIAVAATATVVTAIEILSVVRRTLRSRRALGAPSAGNLGATSAI